MKKYLEILINGFSLNYVMAIFNDDAHGIISERGKEILNNKTN